jgi:hypothetical protein
MLEVATGGLAAPAVASVIGGAMPPTMSAPARPPPTGGLAYDSLLWTPSFPAATPGKSWLTVIHRRRRRVLTFAVVD